MTKNPLTAAMKILIIDDSDNIRKVLLKGISKLNIFEKLMEADDVESGYQSILKNKPNIIILDLMLKTGNGFEILERLQSGNFNSRVIVYSNFLSKAAIEKALETGAYACFDKSSNILDLLEIIQQTAEQEL